MADKFTSVEHAREFYRLRREEQLPPVLARVMSNVQHLYPKLLLRNWPHVAEVDVRVATKLTEQAGHMLADHKAKQRKEQTK